MMNNCEQSEGAEGGLAELSEAPAACIYGNCRQHIKYLKMVIEIWNENQF